MLRQAEAHVRVMASRDTVQTGAERNTLVYKGRNFGPFSSVRQIADTNKKFFDDCLRKVVFNAMAGQSYSIVVMGPPSSGRSQTVYNVVDSDPGIVHLFAEELLAQQNRGAVHVDFSAFHVRGDRLFDSANGELAACADFAAPLGAIPLVTTRPLVDAASCVIVPEGKRAASTCCTSFHVYTPLTQGNVQGANGAVSVRRDAFATITIFDLAQFDVATPPDVQVLGVLLHQINTTSSAALEATNYKNCMLTRLLEQTLGGGAATLIAIATITGRPELAEPNMSTLNVLEGFGRIRQVATLLQIAPPRWLANVPKSAATFRDAIANAYDSAFQRGLAESYQIWSKFISARQTEGWSAIAQLGEDLSHATHIVENHVEEEKTAAAQHASQQSAMTTQFESEVAIMEKEVASLDHRLNELASETGRWNSEEIRLREWTEQETQRINSELAEKLTLTRQLQQDAESSQRAIATMEARRRDAEKEIARLTELVQFDHSCLIYDASMERLHGRRTKLEQQLTRASDQVGAAHSLAKADRDRRSLVQRVSVLEQKATIKRSRQRSTSPAPAFQILPEGSAQVKAPLGPTPIGGDDHRYVTTFRLGENEPPLQKGFDCAKKTQVARFDDALVFGSKTTVFS